MTYKSCGLMSYMLVDNGVHACSLENDILHNYIQPIFSQKNTYDLSFLVN